MCIPETKLTLEAVESKLLSSDPLLGVQISTMGRLLQNMIVGYGIVVKFRSQHEANLSELIIFHFP